MRLLHVVASMDPSQGGISQAIRSLVPELEKLGVYNEVICMDDSAADFLGKDDFLVHAGAKGKGPWHYSKKLVPWLLLHFHRFDAVLVHGLWLYPSYAVYKAHKHYTRKNSLNSSTAREAPKIYVMPHGMLDPYFQKAADRRLKAIRNWGYWKLLEEQVINTADGVLFTCEEELQLARQSFRPYKPRREINIGFGIDLPPIFTPAMRQAFLEHCPELQSRPYLLFLSRINEKKGVDILIQSYEAILRQNTEFMSNTDGQSSHLCYSELPILVVAGPGLTTPYGNELLALVNRSDALANKVIFPGMLSGDAKWGAFYGCEAFILPSHQENFGIAVVEALACGRPVLISNQVNIWREIEATGGGLVADDTREGAQLLLQKWCSLSKFEKQLLSEKSRITYDKHFAIGPPARKLEEALH